MLSCEVESWRPETANRGAVLTEQPISVALFLPYGGFRPYSSKTPVQKTCRNMRMRPDAISPDMPDKANLQIKRLFRYRTLSLLRLCTSGGGFQNLIGAEKHVQGWVPLREQALQLSTPRLVVFDQRIPKHPVCGINAKVICQFEAHTVG